MIDNFDIGYVLGSLTTAIFFLIILIIKELEENGN